MSTPSLHGNSSLLQDKGNGVNSPQSASGSGDSGTSNQQSAARLKKKLLAGRILTTLAGLFLTFDGVGKLMMPAPVVEATGRLGFPARLIPGVGILILACTLVYMIPRTAVLGAILLTGFLGGAVAIQMRAGSPLFETLFPVIFGVLLWAGIYLRECRLWALVPMRR